MQGSSLASLGAALLILMLALDPITQQSISYPLSLRHDSSGTATVPFSTYYTAAELGSFGSATNTIIESALLTFSDTPGTGDVPAQGALSQGLTSSGTVQPIQPTCSTGNCTFPVYNTLGLCASIVDVSDLLNSTCDTRSMATTCVVGLNGVFPTTSVQLTSFNLFMPGSNVTDPQNAAAANVTAYPTINNVFANVSLPAAVVYAYYAPSFNSPDKSSPYQFVAYELSLAYCVQTLQTNVSEGIAATGIINTETEFENTTTAMPSMRYNDTLFYITTQPDIYLMMRSMFNGNWSRLFAGPANDQEVTLDSTIGVAAMRFAVAAEGVPGLRRVWQNVATSMTNE
jgi:hypothetical protein